MRHPQLLLSLAIAASLTLALPHAHGEDGRQGWLFQRGEATPVHGPRPEKSRLQKWTSTAQQTLAKTRDRLNPWHEDKPVDPIEASRNFFNPRMANREEPRPGVIRRWLTPAEEAPPKPLTVPDWMSLERPGFENR